MDIGNKISSLRKHLGYSQEELAEKINVSRQTISKWELNETSPDLKEAKKLSQIFGVSLDELAGNEIKDILITKVSNTEILAGMIIRILKVIGVMLISSIVGLAIMFVIFGIMDSKGGKLVSESHVAYCTFNGENKFYQATVNSDSPGIIEYSTDDDRSLIDMGIDLTNYKSIDKLIEDVVKYVESTGGKCN